MGEGGGFPWVRAMVSLVCQSARGLSQHGPQVPTFCNSTYVATLVSPKWECQTPTPENGSLESSGTPENSEDDLKDQNTLL